VSSGLPLWALSLCHPQSRRFCATLTDFFTAPGHCGTTADGQGAKKTSSAWHQIAGSSDVL
jgi:hypothetical protein